MRRLTLGALTALYVATPLVPSELAAVATGSGVLLNLF
jgi:hypothetical protein